MTTIESAWPAHPDYRIDLTPIGRTARVWFGDLLLAESGDCLLLAETRHVDRLYFPRSSVRWELFRYAEGVHTVCPFKGRAEYWDLCAVDPAEAGIVWAYPDPFDEVAGIRDFVCFYQERTRIETEERWAEDGPDARTRTTRFPVWGDAAELTRLMDVTPAGESHFVAPAHGASARNVVEGGQLLGDAIVAASKAVPDQRVASAYITFSRAASFDEPLDISVDIPHHGRSFATVSVRISQNGKLRSSALLLTARPADHVIQHGAQMPEVAGPEEAVPLDAGLLDRDVRIVDGAYDQDPDRVGPPEIYAWCRFRHDPGPPYLHAALLGQSTTHWTIAAAMLPHPGVGQALAHRTLSTGVMSVAISFHDDLDVRDWHLYVNRATHAGNGLAHGEGRIYSYSGRLVASYSCDTMIRAFQAPPGSVEMDYSTVM